MNDKVESPVLSRNQQKKLAAQKHNEAMRTSLTEDKPLTLEQREELEALSKEVFGSTSRYSTILRNGLVQAVTEETTEYVPAVLDADGKEVTPEETRVVQVPVKLRHATGRLSDTDQIKIARYTPETVKVYMLDLKAKQDAFRAAVAKAQAEQQAKAEQQKLVEQVQNQASGSAI